MGEKTITLRHEGGMRFVSRTQSGHDIVVDNAGGNTGPRILDRNAPARIGSEPARVRDWPADPERVWKLLRRAYHEIRAGDLDIHV